MTTTTEEERRTMTTETTTRRRITAGRFSEFGRRYVLELEYREEPAQLRETGATVDHGLIPADALEIAISGETYIATRDGRRDRRYSDCVSAGQNISDLRKIHSPRARRIAELWDRYHLNGLRAACSHMAARAAELYRLMPDYGHDAQRWEKLRRLECPEGHAYGAAWLWEKIPAADLEELRAIFGVTS